MSDPKKHAAAYKDLGNLALIIRIIVITLKCPTLLFFGGMIPHSTCEQLLSSCLELTCVVLVVYSSALSCVSVVAILVSLSTSCRTRIHKPRTSPIAQGSRRHTYRFFSICMPFIIPYFGNNARMIGSRHDSCLSAQACAFFSRYFPFCFSLF